MYVLYFPLIKTKNLIITIFEVDSKGSKGNRELMS